MTIKKINKIKGFGIFKDFRFATSIQEFKKYNLLYGWNYSGKTTLSRVFRSFETQEEHPDYAGAEFELEDDNRNKYKHSNLTMLPNVRVFNQDFIGKNLKWYADGEHIEPIFLLGEENVELQDQLDKKKEEVEKLKAANEALQKEYEQEEEQLRRVESNCAREIKQQLALPDYEVRNLRPILNSLEDTGAKLSDSACKSALSEWRSPGKLESLVSPQLPEIETNTLLEEVKAILAKAVSGKPIEKFKNDSRFEEWAQEGITLHEHEKECQFCGNQITQARRDELSGHFSENYKKLQDQIGVLRKRIEERKAAPNNLTADLHDKARFYQELQSEYETNRKALVEEGKKVIAFLGWLTEQLENKQTKTFEAVYITPPEQIEFEPKAKFDNISAVIDKHNQKTANFEQVKNEAKERLIKHYASDFLERENYKTKQEEIKTKKEKHADQLTQLTTLAGERAKIEAKLSDALKGATKVNDYIKQLFQHDGIRIEVTSENKFMLKRNGFSAGNLSEGEKTAISFAYFITCLEDRNTNLSDTIVFIDDPVSSLDSNHLFNIYAFIKSKLWNCAQLFISTHNLEFFNLLKDWMKDRCRGGVQENERSFYLVKRILKQGDFEATLEPLPDALERFKSEYHYLFSILKKFDDLQDANFAQLFQMPNITRRFLEAYLGFRIPNEPKPLNNLPKLIEDETERNKVDKFLNEYSHNESATRSLVFNDFSECREVVKSVLKAVEAKDKDHYNALCENC